MHDTTPQRRREIDLVKHILLSLIIAGNASAQTFTKVTEGPIATDVGRSTGVAWGDYDDDGDLDLFVTNESQNNFLYNNNGDGTFTAVLGGQLVSDGGWSDSATWADFDNDGDLDLYVANEGGQFSREIDFLYSNNGDGTFTKVQVGALVNTVAHSMSGSWNDYNNDGYLDLYIAIRLSSNFLYHNNGDGTFSDSSKSPLSGAVSPTSLGAWADYDNDGDRDLFVTNGIDPRGTERRNLLYTSNGDGSFAEVLNNPVVSERGFSWGGSWGDYNNDGYLDLFVTNFSGEDNYLFTNNGDGTFTEVTTGAVVNNGGFSTSGSWGDYDNDGDLDLFVSNGLFSGRPNFLYNNNGDGTFTPVTGTALVTTSSHSTGASWADVDNDGDLDLIVANYSNQAANELFINNGNSNHWINLKLIGRLSNRSAIGAQVRLLATIGGSTYWQMREISSQSGFLSQNSLNVEFGLGDATIIDSIKIKWPSGFDWDTTNVSVDQFLTILENTPPRNPFIEIAAGPEVLDVADSRGTAWGDYDGDGDEDLFVANFGENNALYNNNGDGTFAAVLSGSIVTDGGSSMGAVWGDYDNDGDLDLFVTNANNKSNFLYINSGDGTFVSMTSGPVVSDGSDAQSGAWGDYDGDHDLDLFVTNTSNQPNVLYTNNGDGSFSVETAGPFATDGGDSRGATWGDYDGDGDLDLFVANANNQANFLYTNDGSGSFSRVTGDPIATDPGDSFGGSWGDYDNDGDLDLFVTNLGANNALYTNNGDGSFTAETMGPLVTDGGKSQSAAWGDFDNDGDLDLFLANRLNQSNTLYANDGNGTFIALITGAVSTDAIGSIGSSWADYDADGDLDLFVTNSLGRANSLFTNKGSANHWISLKLAGTLSNVSAIGARVRVKAIIGDRPVWQMREVSSQSGYLSQNSFDIQFGIGDATIIDSIVIEWPSGVSWDTVEVAIDQFLTIAEQVGPKISDIAPSPSIPAVNETVTVTATVENDFGTKSVSLFYKSGGRTTYTDLPMTNQGGSTYSGTIPASVVTSSGISIYVWSEDDLGNVRQSETSSIQIAFSSETLSSAVAGSAFPNGVPSEKWRLIGLPGDLDSRTLSSTIQDELGGAPSDETWGIFRFGGTGRDDYSAATSMEIGESYWLKQFVSEDLAFSLGGGQSVDLGNFEIALIDTSWNLISSPYPFEVGFEVDDTIHYGPFTYGPIGSDGQEGWTELNSITSLKPWGGYILFNKSTMPEVFTITPLVSTNTIAKQSTVSNGWTITFSVEGANYVDHGNVIGRIAGAKEGLDTYDQPELPFVDGYISMTMENDLWAPAKNNMSTDLRGDDRKNGVWNLAVRSKQEQNPITLTYTYASKSEDGLTRILVDQLTRDWYPLNKTGEINLPRYTEAFPRRLKVVVGDDAYVAAAVEDILSALPEDFALSQNFPNPFNPSTTIRFAVPYPAVGSIKVYNLLGQEVISLYEGWMDLGNHEIIWNGRDSAGRNLASGIYFALFAADGKILTRKMVLLK